MMISVDGDMLLVVLQFWAEWSQCWRSQPDQLW